MINHLFNMLVAVDIGNSNIVIACWNDGQWNEPLRLNTHPASEKEYHRHITKWIDKQQIEADAVSSIILSSVVPQITDFLINSLVSLFAISPYVLNHKTDTGITPGADHPERIGTDLIANAAGAYALVKNTCIIVDFGTATTVMAVEKPGILRGGAICAGLKASVEALVSNTAQLQDIPLKIPVTPIGENTVACMQSGLVLGHICMIEGLIDRIKNELGPAKVVATGGLVSTLAPHTDYFNYIDPMLTLNGLRLIAERQRTNGKGEK